MPLRFTILGDGRTDRALRPIARWVFNQLPAVANSGFVVEFTIGPYAADNSLSARVDAALKEFPCDMLLVHRDAEKEQLAHRVTEIDEAVRDLRGLFVPLVPVRMTEAWLLIDERAIRRAAGNPNGTTTLDMPALTRLEHLPDPKDVCNGLLISASETSGRRRKKFSRDSELALRRTRVAELIEDFSLLNQLPAFSAFRNRVTAACNDLQR